LIDVSISLLYHQMMNLKGKGRVRQEAADFMGTVNALADFRRGLRLFLSFSESMVGTVGITSPQYQALLILLQGGAEGVIMRDLAAQMLLVPHGAVQLVNRLSEAGLAERRGDASDGRVSRVYPTPKAVQLMKILVGAHARELRHQERLLADSLRALRKLGRTETTP
jgi:DNA-binding MarR family transcriptional regulator